MILYNFNRRDSSIKFCNKLRVIIENSKPVKDVSYTVSIGMTEILDSDEDINIALKRADLAMYEAKESGRNRVVDYRDLIK